MIDFVERYVLVHKKEDCFPRHTTIKAAHTAQMIGGMSRRLDGEEPLLGEYYTVGSLEIVFDDGWVLPRPSGTEPKFRIYPESKDTGTAKRRSDQFVREVADILG